MGHIFVKNRATVFTTVVVSVAFVLTGCSANQSESAGQKDSAAASSSSESRQQEVVGETASSEPSSKPAPSPSASLSAVAQESIELLERDGIKLADVVEVKGGSYPQYEVKTTSRLATFDPSTHVDGTPKGWSKGDLEKAQVFASNVLLNAVMDNPTANDYEANKDIFAEQLKDILAPKYADVFIDQVLTNNLTTDEKVFMGGLFVHENFTSIGDTSKGFRYASDGETPRIGDISDVKIDKTQNWKGDAYYNYVGTIGYNVVDKKNNPYYFRMNLNIGVTVAKVDGKFLLSGLHNDDAKWMNPVPITQ